MGFSANTQKRSYCNSEPSTILLSTSSKSIWLGLTDSCTYGHAVQTASQDRWAVSNTMRHCLDVLVATFGLHNPQLVRLFWKLMFLFVSHSPPSASTLPLALVRTCALARLQQILHEAQQMIRRLLGSIKSLANFLLLMMALKQYKRKFRKLRCGQQEKKVE